MTIPKTSHPRIVFLTFPKVVKVSPSKSPMMLTMCLIKSSRDTLPASLMVYSQHCRLHVMGIQTIHSTRPVQSSSFFEEEFEVGSSMTALKTVEISRFADGSANDQHGSK